MAKRTKRQIEATERLKEKIVYLSGDNITQKEIARKCRCSQQYVSKVLAKEKVA